MVQFSWQVQFGNFTPISIILIKKIVFLFRKNSWVQQFAVWLLDWQIHNSCVTLYMPINISRFWKACNKHIRGFQHRKTIFGYINLSNTVSKEWRSVSSSRTNRQDVNSQEQRGPILYLSCRMWGTSGFSFGPCTFYFIYKGHAVWIERDVLPACLNPLQLLELRWAWGKRRLVSTEHLY